MWDRIRTVPDYQKISFQFDRSDSATGNQWFFTNQLVEKLRLQIFRFSEDRFKAHTYPLNAPMNLMPDASNLPKVIGELQGSFGNATVQEFNKLVHEVFPEIFEVGTISEPILGCPDQQQFSIWIWPVESEYRRPDLKIHLKDCGNGVGQVLAILYILVTSTQPRIILIDEPTSFLHSVATRKLMEILANYGF